jgi:hypothetical protein
LAQVPFEETAPEGRRLVLLRAETGAAADVGSVTPHLGARRFVTTYCRGGMVSRRRQLRPFISMAIRRVP